MLYNNKVLLQSRVSYWGRNTSVNLFFFILYVAYCIYKKFSCMPIGSIWFSQDPLVKKETKAALIHFHDFTWIMHNSLHLTYKQGKISLHSPYIIHVWRNRTIEILNYINLYLALLSLWKYSQLQKLWLQEKMLHELLESLLSIQDKQAGSTIPRSVGHMILCSPFHHVLKSS